MKKIIVLIGCILTIHTSWAQSLQLEEEFLEQDVTDTFTGIAITGDTIQIEYVDVGYVGNVGMGIAISLRNTSNQAKITGAKKIHFSPLQNDVDHIFCFADQCYGENVFVSPNTKTLNANTSDSGTSGRFIAHYNFNTLTHIPGTELVAYSFYDVNNPSDSSVVWVKYKTPVFTTGIQNQSVAFSFSNLYPNPANESVTFERGSTTTFELDVLLTSITGEKIATLTIPGGEEKKSMSTSSLSKGIYFCSFFENGTLLATQKLVVTH